MTILKFKGTVEFYPENGDCDFTVDSRDVITEVEETFKDGQRVYVALADDTFEGDLYAEQYTRGYSEWTPGDPSQLTVGPHDIRRILHRHDEKEITLWIADEPVNTLGDAQDE